MSPNQQKKQWGFKFDHLKYARDRAMEREDFYQAEIFNAQAAWYYRQIHNIQETNQNRNQWV